MTRTGKRNLWSRIAGTMVNDSSRANTRVPAGYTYFGQFIAHDIVENSDPACTSRVISPSLNLDSLYGSQYDERDWRDLFDGDGCFRVDGIDVRRDAGHAVIPEQRNDENVITIQFHRLWQDFHNRLIRGGMAEGPTKEARVAAARRLVTLTFQIVTVQDFLARVLDCQVFKRCFEQDQRYLQPGLAGIPTAFSHGAFRFGHSTVRGLYRLRPDRSPPVDVDAPVRLLHDLLQGRRANRQIDAGLEINWLEFFGADAQPSFLIDTMIASPMGEVPDCHPGTRAGDEINIGVRNLEAGARAGTGFEYLRQLQRQPNYQELQQDIGLEPITSLSGAPFENVGIEVDELPLWLYVVLEAQQFKEGRSLGPMGSLIVAETLRFSIERAADSIYFAGKLDVPRALSSMGKWGEVLSGTGRIGMPEIIEFVH